MAGVTMHENALSEERLDARSLWQVLVLTLARIWEGMEVCLRLNACAPGPMNYRPASMHVHKAVLFMTGVPFESLVEHTGSDCSLMLLNSTS